MERARITPGYFETLGVRLLAGRDFTAGDDSTGASVAIVNESAARVLWPDGDPLGQGLSMIFILRRTPVTVVGISPDLRSFSRDRQARPELMVPLAQSPVARQWILVRSSGAAGDLASAIRDEIRRMDPDIPPPIVETAHQRRVRVRAHEKFFADLTGAHAFLGILFSTVGLFGILSLEVSQRSREVGLRMALGAQRRQVINWDPVSFAGAALLLLAVTLGVGIAPALRAGAVNPGTLLRSE